MILLRRPASFSLLSSLVFGLATIPVLGLCGCSTAGAEATRAAPAAATSAASEEAPSKSRPASQRDTATRSDLGRAVAEVERNPAQAVRELDALGKTMPWVDDVTAYYAALAEGRVDSARGVERFEAFLEDYPSSVLFPDAAADLASLLGRRGDTARALALADRYGRQGADTSSTASICLEAGRLLAKEDPRRAAVYLQCARTKAPLSDAARSAYDLLTGLRATDSNLRPSGAEDLMQEARLLAREGRGKQQVATLGDLLKRYPGSSHEWEATLAYGRALGRNESKAAGGDFFVRQAKAASGARKAKFLYEAATLRWNDDRNAEALDLFEQMLALKTGSGDEQQALYAVARIHDSRDKRGEAIRFYGRAAAQARGAARAESQWRQGWVSYRARDYETARQSFADTAARATRGSDTDGRAETLYWEGRSLERLGRRDQAQARYRQVLEEFPVGYYAAASEKRLGTSSPGRIAVQPLKAPSNLPPSAALAIRRATTLREAGLPVLAARDLSARLQGFDAATRRAVLPALPAAGAYDAAFRIAIAMHGKGELSSNEARVYFYPRAYADIVEAECRRAGIDPLLVYALMRQESAFSSTAVSPAKALGLMQLLEKTARRVAASQGLDEPSAEDLFNPAVNIRLGVGYLAMLSKQFQGNTALMAASYNAGENAAERWKGLTKTYDEDEMIEQISYRETRAYVKAVLRNMRNYRRIYGSDPG